jgi:hypothetical protein
VNQRLFGKYGRVVDQKLRRKVVGAINDDVKILDRVERVLGGEAIVDRHHRDVGIKLRHFLARGVDLGARHVGRVMNHLALEVGEIDHVAVDQADGADPGGRQVQCGG